MTTKRELGVLEDRRSSNIARMMFLCLDVFRGRILAKLKGHGYASIRWSDGTVLRYVDREGTPLSEIARRGNVSRQAVAKVASVLAASGYLRIVPDRNHGRVKIVRFTAKGLRLSEVITTINEEVEREFATVMGQPRINDLRATLIAMVNAELPSVHPEDTT